MLIYGRVFCPIVGMMIQSDELHHFSEGLAQPPTRVNFRYPQNIWGLPEIGVPQNHPLRWDFQFSTIHLGVPPWLWKPPKKCFIWSKKRILRPFYPYHYLSIPLINILLYHYWYIYIYNIDRHVDHRRDYQNWSTINPYQWGILIKSSIYELDFPWINHEINHDIHIICLLASASQKNFSLTGPSPGESRDNLHKVTQRGKTKRKLRCTFLNFSILCRISYPDFFFRKTQNIVDQLNQ